MTGAREGDKGTTEIRMRKCEDKFDTAHISGPRTPVKQWQVAYDDRTEHTGKGGGIYIQKITTT